MKTKKLKISFIIAVCALALLAVAGILPLRQAAQARQAPATHKQYTCSMHPFIIKDKPGDCPICGMKLTPVKSANAGARAAAPVAKNETANGKRKIKYWVAPMDPTYIRSGPGKSPMGMDLVPVYEDQAPNGPLITIDPVTVQNMGIRTAKVTRRDLYHTLRTVGLIGYEEPRQYTVNTKVSGWVERLYVNQTGQQVKKGGRLLDIYSPDLLNAQEEFLLALNNNDALAKSPFPAVAAGAKSLLSSSRKRLKLWDISDRQIAELKKNRKVRKTMTLYSPYSGIVTKKMVNEGMQAKEGMELFEISDISRVWVYADIYEYELPWVKVGQEAQITMPFADARTIKGKVGYLYPYVEPKTRTVKARLEFVNPDFILKPEMYVNVLIKTDPLANVLSIPEDAVLDSGTAKTVFVALGNGKFEPRQIKTGLEGQDGFIEVRQGLLENEQVVTSSQFMLDSESNLRAAVRNMLEANKKEKASAPPPAPKKPAKEDLNDLF